NSPARRAPALEAPRSPAARPAGQANGFRRAGAVLRYIIAEMANLITVARLLLLIVVVLIAYQPYSYWHFVNVLLLILVFVSDGIDGYVARKRNETSVFGAMFDIASDRMTELTMWIVLVDLDIVAVWVPLV